MLKVWAVIKWISMSWMAVRNAKNETMTAATRTATTWTDSLPSSIRFGTVSFFWCHDIAFCHIARRPNKPPTQQQQKRPQQKQQPKQQHHQHHHICQKSCGYLSPVCPENANKVIQKPCSICRFPLRIIYRPLGPPGIKYNSSSNDALQLPIAILIVLIKIGATFYNVFLSSLSPLNNKRPRLWYHYLLSQNWQSTSNSNTVKPLFKGLFTTSALPEVCQHEPSPRQQHLGAFGLIGLPDMEFDQALCRFKGIYSKTKVTRKTMP